jgi:transglutaminase-like putative cysteine protease
MVPESRAVDWASARRASYLVSQTFRYEYPEPAHNLNHRLVVIPPERFGDQRRLRHRLTVGLEDVRVVDRADRFGNRVYEVFAPRVPSSIEFTVEISIERHAAEPNRLPAAWITPYLLEPSRLTAPDARLSLAAEQLAASGATGLDLADQINDWVYQSMTYRAGVTEVRTTAAEALELGVGVCQDYSHVMLAICRACGLPSRYVSGHLLGQGGTHAWVEVVLPTDDGTGDAIAWAFDPTHAGRGGLGYVTIAVGRDYSDVAPTSGTYLSRVAGKLISRRSVTLTDLELEP